MGKKKVRIDRAESTVQERIVGAEEKKAAGRKLYHTASLGSLLYVTRIRNEETNDRPNESAHAARPFPLPTPLSLPHSPTHPSLLGRVTIRSHLRGPRTNACKASVIVSSR